VFLRIQILWCVTQCCWVSDSRRFEKCGVFIFKDKLSRKKKDPLPLKKNAPQYFETSGTTHSNDRESHPGRLESWPLNYHVKLRYNDSLVELCETYKDIRGVINYDLTSKSVDECGATNQRHLRPQ
jgi:hypothetical protein